MTIIVLRSQSLCSGILVIGPVNLIMRRISARKKEFLEDKTYNGQILVIEELISFRINKMNVRACCTTDNRHGKTQYYNLYRSFLLHLKRHQLVKYDQGILYLEIARAPMPKILKNKDDGEKFVKRSSRHDPIARPTLLAQMEGAELKTKQPRSNKKRKVKQRIYEKLKKSTADEEHGLDEDNLDDIADSNVVRQAQLQAMDIREEESSKIVQDDEEDDLSYDSDDAQSTYSAKTGIDDYQQYLQEEQLITEEEEVAFNSFLNPTSAKVRTIADLIEEKLQQKRAAGGASENQGMHLHFFQGRISTNCNVARDFRRQGDVEMDEEEPEVDELDPKVISVYQGVGKLLTRYKSGKLPKALKIAPNLTNWEQIIGITNPPT